MAELERGQTKAGLLPEPVQGGAGYRRLRKIAWVQWGSAILLHFGVNIEYSLWTEYVPYNVHNMNSFCKPDPSLESLCVF